MVRFCMYCSSSGNNVLQQYHMYCCAAVLLVITLFTAVGRQMSEFEPYPPCFCFVFGFFSVRFWDGLAG